MMKILSSNLRAYPLSHTNFMKAIEGIAELIRAEDPQIVALQEVAPGKDSFYLGKLQTLLPDYEVILPEYDALMEHYRSAVNIMLVKKDSFTGIEKKTIEKPKDEELDFSGLYNWISLSRNGLSLELFNMHAIQLYNDNKPEAIRSIRSKKSDAFWDYTLKQVFTENRNHFIALGDFNAENGKNIEEITRFYPDTFVSERKGISNYTYFGRGVMRRYDHVFAQVGMSYVNLTPVLEGYSDHAALIYVNDEL